MLARPRLSDSVASHRPPHSTSSARRLFVDTSDQRSKHAWFGPGIDLCRLSARVYHVVVACPHLARTALLRYGRQESRPPHLRSDDGSRHGGPDSAALVPSARRPRVAVLRDILGIILL